MLDIKPEVAVAAIDELSRVIYPQVDAALQKAVAALIEGFKESIKGRTITITIQ